MNQFEARRQRYRTRRGCCESCCIFLWLCFVIAAVGVGVATLYVRLSRDGDTERAMFWVWCVTGPLFALLVVMTCINCISNCMEDIPQPCKDGGLYLIGAAVLAGLGYAAIFLF